MGYKRLTETKEINKYCSTVECGEYCEDCYVGKLYERLCELEDKIENGELFSIPFMWENKKINAYTVIYEDDDYEYLMGTCFTGENAKSEAEKFLEQKLKELKGEV